ncbi:3'(2'),5'-bisphosphate nucleotidase CysQ [Pseudohongiella sp.]|uniref:3'-phosphoadenosine 5'-phosphate phosphatase n=1 Tax=marine sediment metagenome TaxID=412755 RepID=A0A0F9YI08_9ZZZZ|nr:3'(2'),5'-bisphosphate nucleotidase CysQ [Pseudohongiella sp.]HDZ08475.1 3'(2'),5'-bisphosphate nucleotidase [Pseudohongiella sp.]HEA61787.1 3'(2'),5'-bisphosphate nucleotidase [Pseudohongiella sp.]
MPDPVFNGTFNDTLLNNRAELLKLLTQVARDAGSVIMAVYATDFTVRGKEDESPVTEADEKAEQVIVSALRKLTPQVPVIAEEAMAAGHRESVGDLFWLVDPLDGTREFVNRNGEFTVNIALIENGVPVLGVVYAPVIDRMFAGASEQGAFVVEAGGQQRPVRTREVPAAGLTVVASRSHGDPQALQAFLGERTVAELRTAGSSLKICLVAAGEADLYPRFGRTMEWDIAAGDAVLRAAGGRLTDMNEQAMAYGKPGFENPNFVVWGR